MKRQNKQAALFLLAVVFCLTAALTGCTSGQPEESASPTQAPAATPAESEATEPAGEIWNQKFDPPVTITTAVIVEPRENAFKEGESIEDNVHLRWMKENMGIDVKFDFVVNKQEDFNTKMNLIMAGGGKLPDVHVGGPLTSELIDAGMLMPLNDAIEQYASPNIKKMFAEFPSAFNGVTHNGQIYGIPQFMSGDGGAVMWIRQDWLDNLNLTAPTTIDEFEKVLEAFTKQDPDQNGQNDTFGLALSLKDGVYTWMATADPLVSAFTGKIAPETRFINHTWDEDENGKLVYTAVDPAIKPFLTAMQRWMTSGYVDPEAGVKDAAKATEMAVQGKAGIIFGPAWMGDWPLVDTAKVAENAVFKPFPVPAGPDGKLGRLVQMTSGSVVFSKDFKHIDAWFAYYNKMYASQFGKEDPYYDPRFENGFHEGYDYVLHDGKVIKNNFEAAGVPADQWPLPSGQKMDMRYNLYALHGTFAVVVPFLNGSAYEKFHANPEADSANPAEEDIKSLKPSQIEAGVVEYSQPGINKFNKFEGRQTETMRSKGALLTKMESEAYLEIIYGKKPVDYFDQFVQEFMANGGEQITKEANEWYETTK